jgi:tryptophan synthase beta chain
MEAFRLLTRTEGIIPAIESAHAVALAVKVGAQYADGTRTTEHGGRPLFIVNVSGRGDKDVDTAATWFGMHPEQSGEEQGEENNR